MDREECSKTGSGCAGKTDWKGREKHIWYWKLHTTRLQSMNDNGDPQTDWWGHREQQQPSLTIDQGTNSTEVSQEENIKLLMDPKFREDEQQGKEVLLPCALHLHVLCYRINVRFIKRLKERVHTAAWPRATNQTGSQSGASASAPRQWAGRGAAARPAKNQPQTNMAGDRHHS